MAQISVLNSSGATITVGHVEDLGQAAMAASLPVVIASDQTSIPVATTAVVPGTGATNLGKAEDSVHATGDVGVMILGVRNDSSASSFCANGDYSPIAVNSTGAVIVSLGSGAVGVAKAEDVASASGDAGVFTLAIRRDSDGSNCANGDYTEFQTDARGNLKVQVTENSAVTARHGTITTGGVAQQLAAANTVRRGIWVINLSEEVLYVDETGTAAATTPSITLYPQEQWEPKACGFGAISIFGATTGQAFNAREW